LKNPTQNRAGGVSEVVECLPSKCETLSSNSSSTAKLKKKKKKKRIMVPGKQDPVSKITRAKRAGCMAQMVECLPA
jgi:hypothetical protein